MTSDLPQKEFSILSDACFLAPPTCHAHNPGVGGGREGEREGDSIAPRVDQRPRNELDTPCGLGSETHVLYSHSQTCILVSSLGMRPNDSLTYTHTSCVATGPPGLPKYPRMYIHD